MTLLDFDLSLIAESAPLFLIGVDEAGRGPLAGPVTAAAAYVPPAAYPFLAEINDSKKLTEAKRVKLLSLMRGHGVLFGFGFSTAAEIDELNILRASLLAMRRATDRLFLQLGSGPALVLVDGQYKIPGVNISQRAVIDGDAKSLAIAAASIFAKVTRDRWLLEINNRWPGYEFAAHKGYGTKKHLERLSALGPCPEHRLSFAPLKKTAV